MTRARLTALLGASALAILTGCSATGGSVESDSRATVYVSVPLSGSSAADGHDVVLGAKLALAAAGGRAGELPVEARYLDEGSASGATPRWSPAQAAANARRAVEDSTAIAYLGDFDSGATRSSLPITNEAHLLQVSPASTAVDLVQPFPGSDDVPEVQPSGDRTFGRVIPDDEALADARRAWAKELGTQRIGVLYPGDDAASLARHGDRFVVSPAQDPSELPSSRQTFTHEYRKHYGTSPGPYSAYGYEAMSVILDSIERAGDEGDQRQPVIDSFFDTTDRRSILGTYSIDSVGDTTLGRLAGYRVLSDGNLRFDRPLHAP